MTRLFVLLITIGLGAIAAGQKSSTIGVLPFVDESSSGTSSAGTSASRALQSALGTSPGVTARALGAAAGAGHIDDERAAAIGREHNVKFVFVGIVREASASESTRSGWLPRIQGQTVNVDVRSIKAAVKLEGQLYDVARGRRIAGLRAEGTNTDSKFSGTLWSSIGAWDVGNDAAFRESPLGKAMHEAIENMASRLTTELARQ